MGETMTLGSLLDARDMIGSFWLSGDHATVGAKWRIPVGKHASGGHLTTAAWKGLVRNRGTSDVCSKVRFRAGVPGQSTPESMNTPGDAPCIREDENGRGRLSGPVNPVSGREAVVTSSHT